MTKNSVTIIGGGLAGAEAAWQAAQRGMEVLLYEMRPLVATPAHKTDRCAELVCSNSLGNNIDGSAPFLLKEELRRFDSLVIRAADKHCVPAGSALAVDRERFAEEITRALEEHPGISIRREEVRAVPAEGPVIVATGPLTSPALSESISRLIGQNYLYFYDAISPIVDAGTIDLSKTFFASRYNKGGDDDYLNCPMDEACYREFIQQLRTAEKVPLHSFEKPQYFEGCMPIEELALRGEMTPAFGPMKPVGLAHPKTGATFFAVVQLRRENREGTAYNLVGFQTKLTFPEQRRVLRTIPGLERVEFFRYGAVHRNTFINSPALLTRELCLKTSPGVYFAGQITGVEGYVESCSIGLLAAMSVCRRLRGDLFEPPPAETALGALMGYVTGKRKTDFQPSNINFGLFPGLDGRVRDREQRNGKIILRARERLACWTAEQKP
jgi:methylenetetrahydrofolate--tRNA-(uracil-5-)-methyltransferase